MMNDVFCKVGKHYGYENVSADFVAFKQFKVQWQRSYNWIAFRISDYMLDAPENIMEDLAESIFAKIAGKQGLYSDGMRGWVLDEDFSIVCHICVEEYFFFFDLFVSFVSFKNDSFKLVGVDVK